MRTPKGFPRILDERVSTLAIGAFLGAWLALMLSAASSS